MSNNLTHVSKCKNGFTLIETVIYIALLTIALGGAFVTSYQLIEGSEIANKKATIQEEGNFVLRKLDWALTGIDWSYPPTVNDSVSCANTLTVRKQGYSDTIFFDLKEVNGNKYVFQTEGSNVSTTTTSNVDVSCILFTYIPASGTKPAGVSATTTINGLDFAITKYLRK